ncbi:MAG: ABC transporter ATP-binding protein [Gammaproteobacteria bacterium]|nr:ABC transporter ATP-binding protein [Gammaproteobacteria bacterium]
MQFIRQAMELLHADEKRKIFSLLGLSVVAAFAQTVAILSIMPFIILLSNPAALETNPMLIRLEQLVAAESPHQLLILLGVIGISALAIGNLFIALENWLIRQYLSLLGHRIEKDLMRTILNRPFEYFAKQHSGRLSNIVLDQVDRVVDGVVGALFGIVSNAVLTALIVLMLLLISFKTTLITLIALVLLYLVVFLTLKRRIVSHGEELTELSGDVHTAVKETLEGIREIKMYRAEEFVARRFESKSLPLARLAVRSGVLDFLPNFVLETLVFSGMVGVGLYFVIVSGEAGMSLSFIALYAMATYRLVPALNGIFEGLAELQHAGDSVRAVREHLEIRADGQSFVELTTEDRDIRMENVSYRYPHADTDQLIDVNLAIPAGSSVCLFGESGAGKSTLLNLIAGLIRPRSGNVLCGGTSIADVSLESWRRIVGLCPQQIYLFDGTIASNIAFGAERHEVDPARIQHVGKLARLERFVAQDASHAYQSMVGEGGMSLSGGQRQRVGIARALYKHADILILDESLAGLDAANQAAILDNLFALMGKTLIMSTHDAAVARRCDKVVLLEQGRLIAEGRYDDVITEAP